MKWLRRLTVFILGLILLIDSLVNNFHVLEFVMATIMMGIIPIDYVIDAISRPQYDENEIARFSELLKDKEPPPGYPTQGN